MDGRRPRPGADGTRTFPERSARVRCVIRNNEAHDESVDGEWIGGADDAVESTNRAAGEALATVGCAPSDDVTRAVGAACAASSALTGVGAPYQ